MYLVRIITVYDVCRSSLILQDWVDTPEEVLKGIQVLAQCLLVVAPQYCVARRVWVLQSFSANCSLLQMPEMDEKLLWKRQLKCYYEARCIKYYFTT